VITPRAALSRILRCLEDLAPLPAERVALSEAVGRALAEELRAGRALPPFDHSRMDGYALRAADVPRPGTRLPVAFESFAGDAPGRALPPGSCARIFTGAPVPLGADSVEMQEEVRRRGRVARFLRAAEKGRFVRAAGSDVAAGSRAIAAGSLVDAGTVGLAAALGRTELWVHRRPRTGVLATGSEIAPVDGPAAPGTIPDSNSHAIAAAASEAGALPVVLPVARDDRASLRRALAAAQGLDALVTIGGVSVGDRDLVRPVLAEAGARIDFWRVAMHPGLPAAFGRIGRLPVFCLPGNPASALGAFEILARPALRALQGLAGSGRLELPARLSAPEEKPRHLTVYLPCELRQSAGTTWAVRLPGEHARPLSSLAGLGALAILPAGVARLRRGAPVAVRVLGSTALSVAVGRGGAAAARRPAR